MSVTARRGSSSRSGSSPHEPAHEVFEDYFSRLLAGDSVDFEDVCRAHPELDPDLRQLHRERRELQPRTLRPVPMRSAAPERPERYGLRGRIGRGGMGEVHRVWDPDMRRYLAMKVAYGPTPGRRNDPGARARFIEEAQLTGRLDHPGIVPVHEVGTGPDERAYFTMRLVRGEELGRIFSMARTRRRGWNQARALGVVLKVCEAMAYAHSRGVIHRDLKPSNVMVGKYGEVYVMDWGLAKAFGGREHGRPGSGRLRLSTASPVSTIDGTVLGTPSYMPPEQARGTLDLVGPHSDVYAVGAMLYTLLTGRAPYVRPGKRPAPETVLHKVLTGPPNPVRRISPTTPEELIAICEKAMARRPRERYRSMAHMAEDLRAYLEGHVVRAYETGAVAEFRKWVLRNKMAAGAILTAVLLTVLALSSISVVLARSKQRIEASNASLQLAILDSEEARAEAVAAKEGLEVANADLLVAIEDLRIARDAAARNEADAVRSKELANDAMQLHQREAATNAELLDFVLGLFELPSEVAARGATISAKEILDSGLRDLETVFQADDVTRLRMLEVVGRTYLLLGLVEEADSVLSRALRIGTDVEGYRAASVLRDLHRVADERLAAGEVARAKELYQLLLGQLEEEHGAGGVTTFACRASLGTILMEEGQFLNALNLLPDAVEGLRRALGDEDSVTLAAILDLAVLYERNGRPWDATPLYEEVLDACRRRFGDRDDRTLEALLHLAGHRSQRGQQLESETLYREAFEAVVESRGPGDTRALDAFHGIAHALRRLDQLRKLEELHREAFGLFVRELGENDVATMQIGDGLVRVLKDQERLREALELARTLSSHTDPADPAFIHRKAMLETLRDRANYRHGKSDPALRR
ncbi:MAG: serine/threonine-protein kinase [Planctomycetota bacterium]